MFRQPAVPSLSALDAADLLGRDPEPDSTDRPVLLVEVRERDEFRDVRAPGAVLYPISSLMYRFQELPRDRVPPAPGVRRRPQRCGRPG